MNTLKPAAILKDKMMKGHPVFGTLIQHAVVPAIVDFIPDGSIDFVIVTAEHNALDIADFMPLRHALAAVSYTHLTLPTSDLV